MCNCPETGLCGACFRVMMDDLRVIAGHYGSAPHRTLFEELDVTMARMDNIASMDVGRVSRGEMDSVLMYREQPSNAKAVLKWAMRDVAMWMRHEYPHIGMDHREEDIAAALLRLPTLLSEHPDIRRIAWRIRYSVVKALESVDRPADRFFLGICEGVVAGQTCNKALYATDQESVRCRLCGTSYVVRELREHLLYLLKDKLVTAKELEGFTFPDGTRLTASAVRGLKHRGLVRSVGKLGRADLFRVGDVTQAIEQRPLT